MITKFEKYNEAKNPMTIKVIGIMRKIGKNKFLKGILTIASIIEDIFVRGNLKAVKQTFVNKSGYNKLSELAMELAHLKYIKSTDTELSFEDLAFYGLDPNIIGYLEDEDVIKYLQIDVHSKETFEKMQDSIEFLKGYAEWAKTNDINMFTKIDPLGEENWNN
jgi:hypothetical protein